MPKSLKNLHLTNNRILEILWDAFPSSLKVLKIEKQKIDEIGNISHMNELIRLEANFNMIKSISEKIGKLQALTIIQLENNLITSLPFGFENLLNLKYLNLKNNRLDHKCGNLEENLWKRLPSNISILKLDGNNLSIIPCLLKKFKLDCLTVNSCNLEYICPFFITEGRKNELIFEIRDNPMLQYLPIIPFKIYQPNNKKDETSDLFSLTEINLITDNKSFVNTSRFQTVLGKPIYKFEYCEENDSDNCQCCASCGNKTDERMFKQLMMMDINLCGTSNFHCSHFLLQKSFKDEHFMEYLHEIEEKSPANKDCFNGPGTWKTMIKARLCLDCLSNFKECIKKLNQDVAMPLPIIPPIHPRLQQQIPLIRPQLNQQPVINPNLLQYPFNVAQQQQILMNQQMLQQQQQQQQMAYFQCQQMMAQNRFRFH